MKRTILGALCFLLIWVSTLNAQLIQTIRIGQNLRMVVRFVDKDGLHLQYFIEPRAGEGPKLLGEEIFKNGEKVFDNYREND